MHVQTNVATSGAKRCGALRSVSKIWTPLASDWWPACLTAHTNAPRGDYSNTANKEISPFMQLSRSGPRKLPLKKIKRTLIYNYHEISYIC